MSRLKGADPPDDPYTVAAVPGAVARTPRRAARPVPQARGELAHLTLEELRGYRADLAAEEGRVSYWRRLVQARMDVLRSGADAPDRRRLRQALAGVPGTRRRLARYAVEADHGDLPLPDLAALWDARPDGPVETAAVLVRLAAAEAELSAYRSDLHRRLDAATGDLVARYRADPSSALAALPRRR